jgi:hypothetical protein
LIIHARQSWKTDPYAEVPDQSAREELAGPPPKQIKAPLSFTFGLTFFRSACSSLTKFVTRTLRHDFHLSSSGRGVVVVFD